ncbi:MAG: tetratricopeptide repeat protein, partial [Myxococcota bacterium]
LALELAAARVAVLAPAQLLARLSQRFTLLRSRKQEVDSHRSTLKTTLDWSWELLTPWEQEALLQCSVFEGSFNLEAAEAVLDLSDWPDAPWSIDTIANLLDKSWLAPHDDKDEEEQRFIFYVSIRAYALDKRTAIYQADGSPGHKGERQEALIRRHARYYTSLPLDCAPWERNFNPNNPCKKERGNLLAIARGPHQEMATTATLALACHYATLGPHKAALELIRPWLETPPGDPHQHLRLMLAYGSIAQDVSYFEQAVVVAQELGEDLIKGWALQMLGTYLRAQKPEESFQHLSRALELGKVKQSCVLQGWTQLSLGRVFVETGKVEEAKSVLHQALAHAREANVPELECMVHGSLGFLSASQHNAIEAIEHLLYALEINTLQGSHMVQSRLLATLGIIYTNVGEFNKADQVLIQSLQLYHDIGSQTGEAWCCFHLGVCYVEQGKRAQALEFFARSLRMAKCIRESSKQRLQAFSLVEWARIDLHMGNLEAAQARVAQSIEHLQQGSENPRDMSMLLAIQVMVQCALGQYPQAAQTLAQVETIHNTLKPNPRGLLGRRLQQARDAMSKRQPPASAGE